MSPDQIRKIQEVYNSSQVSLRKLRERFDITPEQEFAITGLTTWVTPEEIYVKIHMVKKGMKAPQITRMMLGQKKYEEWLDAN